VKRTLQNVSNFTFFGNEKLGSAGTFVCIVYNCDIRSKTLKFFLQNVEINNITFFAHYFSYVTFYRDKLIQNTKEENHIFTKKFKKQD